MKDIASLVKQAQRNDSNAQEELYLKTQSLAYYVVRQILGRDEEAQDVLQVAYIKAYRSISSLKDPNSFQSWLNRIASNCAKDYLRSRKLILFSDMGADEAGDGFPDFVDTDTDYQPEIKMDRDETGRLIRGIVDDLPPEQRLVTMMYYFQDICVKDIAADLSCSENTVKSRLLYARKNIESAVLHHEQQGTKLYGLSPFPFFIGSLELYSKSFSLPAQTVTNMYSTISQQASSHSATASGAATSGQGTSAVTAATGGASGGTAGGISGTAVTATSVIGTKVIVGVVAICVAGGVGAYGIYHATHPDRASEQSTTTVADDEDMNQDMEQNQDSAQNQGGNNTSNPAIADKPPEATTNQAVPTASEPAVAESPDSVPGEKAQQEAMRSQLQQVIKNLEMSFDEIDSRESGIEYYSEESFFDIQLVEDLGEAKLYNKSEIYYAFNYLDESCDGVLIEISDLFPDYKSPIKNEKFADMIDAKLQDDWDEPIRGITNEGAFYLQTFRVDDYKLKIYYYSINEEKDKISIQEGTWCLVTYDPIYENHDENF
jgi:RNA polymerase sigma-70 factor (ECF subfamily)